MDRYFFAGVAAWRRMGIAIPDADVAIAYLFIAPFAALSACIKWPRPLVMKLLGGMVSCVAARYHLIQHGRDATGWVMCGIIFASCTLSAWQAPHHHVLLPLTHVASAIALCIRRAQRRRTALAVATLALCAAVGLRASTCIAWALSFAVPVISSRGIVSTRPVLQPPV